MNRFPEDGQALRRLFQESLSFQSLCDDYQECLAELQNSQQSSSEGFLSGLMSTLILKSIPEITIRTGPEKV
jgi:hypothetical protein